MADLKGLEGKEYLTFDEISLYSENIKRLNMGGTLMTGYHLCVPVVRAVLNRNFNRHYEGQFILGEDSKLLIRSVSHGHRVYRNDTGYTVHMELYGRHSGNYETLALHLE